MHEALQVSVAEKHELTCALAFAFRHLSARDRKEHIDQALHWVKRGQLDPSGILVLREADKVVGSIVCQVVPGHTGLIWPPQVEPGPRRVAGQDRLAQAGKNWLIRNGAVVFQAVLATQEIGLGEPLLRNGFSHITTLHYLRHFLDPRWLLSPEKPRLALERYGQCDREAFHRVLQDSYAGSRDCPELNGKRLLEDILAGHQAQGRHDPDFWWLARHQGHAVGVLLSAIEPEYMGFEISYTGIVPGARRQGLGRELMCQALSAMRAAGASQATLAVDVRNEPGLKLYAGLGFEPFDQREVFLGFAPVATRHIGEPAHFVE